MNCTAVLAVLVLSATGVFAQTPAPGAAMFRIFSGGREIGVDRVLLSQTPEGWRIISTGAIGDPFGITVRKFEARYDAGWKPLELTIDASIADELVALHSTFQGTTVVNELTQGVRQSTTKAEVSADAIILPNRFYSAYEALAARLATAETGSEIPVYVAPEIEVRARVGAVANERLVTPDGTVEARRQEVTFANPNGPLEVVIWTDAAQRLVRLHIPSASLEVIRDDVSSVGVRTETATRAGDEQVNVPANGFNLAATVSKPSTPADRRGWPAVVLVGGSLVVDRDGTIGGVPVFGSLASALADAGFLVIRYDRRGLGQSGGRTEAATLTDYAEDVRAMARYLDERKDVDGERIGVIGHGEGGWVASIAAAKEKRIRSLVLVGTAGTTGAELLLEQQRRALDSMKLTEAERHAKIELQIRIQSAVLSGKGWETIPEELRRQADTPWFASLLSFDPARVLKDVRQPILVLQGEADQQTAVHHADRLALVARARKKGGAVEVVTLPGIDHRLTSGTGPEDKRINPTATTALVDWLKKTLPPER
jgi:pimeloyl-ACP methyl ester carboxylesterase